MLKHVVSSEQSLLDSFQILMHHCIALLIMLVSSVKSVEQSSGGAPILHLLQRAMERSEDPESVCQTLIFPWLQPHDNIAMAFAKTFPLTPQVRIQVNYSRVPPQKESFFDRDRLYGEVLQPAKLGNRRFASQCSVILFHPGDLSVTNVHHLIEHLVSARLVKATNDIFVFHGSTNSMTSLINSPVFSYITFKHVVMYIGESAKISDYSTVVFNFCEGSVTTNELKLRNSARHCKNLLNGRTLTAAVLIGAPHYRHQLNAKGTLQPGGSYHMLYAECGKRLNYTMYPYMVSSTGTKVNGTWAGALGELANRRADVTFPLAYAAGRNFVMDNIRPLHAFDKVFWVKVPGRDSNPEAILAPFSLTTWMALLVLMVLFTALFYVSLQADQSRPLTQPTTSFLNAGSVVLRPLLEQSIAIRVHHGSRTRLLIFLWALSSIIMGNAYRSKLFQFLTFREPYPFPRTYNELAFEFPDYKILYRTYGGVADSYVLRSKNPMHRALLANNRFKIVYAAEVCITGIFKRAEKIACIDFDFAGEYSILANATLYAQAESRGFQLLKRSVDYDGKYIIGWGFKKGSPLKDIIDDLIGWVLDSGLFEYWVKIDWREQNYNGIRHIKRHNSDLRGELEREEREGTERVRPVRLKTIDVPVILGIFGITSSLMVFALEYGRGHSGKNMIHSIRIKFAEAKMASNTHPLVYLR